MKSYILKSLLLLALGTTTLFSETKEANLPEDSGKTFTLSKSQNDILKVSCDSYSSICNESSKEDWFYATGFFSEHPEIAAMKKSYTSVNEPIFCNKNQILMNGKSWAWLQPIQAGTTFFTAEYSNHDGVLESSAITINVVE